MAYCYDFFKKWKKEGNFCGLDETEVSRMNVYMDLVEALVKQRIPEAQIYELFTLRAARPLLSAKGDARTEGLNFVVRNLKEGKNVQARDLQTTLENLTSSSGDKKVGHVQLSGERPILPLEPKKKDPAQCFSPQPGSIVPFTGLQGVRPSTKICRDAKCPSLVKRGGAMATECALSGNVPGNTETCPLYLQFYYQKYPMTAACRKKNCEDLVLQRPSLHLCKITGMRPDNMPGSRCPKDPPVQEAPAAVPEAPIAAALKEKYNGNVSGVKTPPAEIPPAEIPPAKKPACLTLEYEICPDLEHHLKSDKIWGKICEVIGIPLNQLPHNECPLDREIRLKETLPERFKPASAIIDPHSGGTITKPPAYKISKSKLLDSERDAMTDTLIEHTAFTPKDIEQIDEIVAKNREGWTCRFDLVEAAVMMLLAKAEGT